MPGAPWPSQLDVQKPGRQRINRSPEIVSTRYVPSQKQPVLIVEQPFVTAIDELWPSEFGFESPFLQHQYLRCLLMSLRWRKNVVNSTLKSRGSSASRLFFSADTTSRNASCAFRMSMALASVFESRSDSFLS